LWYKSAMTLAPLRTQPELLRAIGRWSMVALALNSILGAGIFGLPATLAGLLGRTSPLAVLLAGAGMSVIVACYAEVASQFTETGGTYLYLRYAFGRLVGLEVGWMSLLARLTACAAAVNLLIAYLGEFWPGVTAALPRLAVVTLFVGTLAAVNYRGVGAGTTLSNATALTKLVALFAVAGAGVVWLCVHPALAAAPVSPTREGWLKAMLLLLFAYGGYEAALNPMGEAKDPRRDVAFALLVAISIIAVLYSTLQLVVVGALAHPAASERPLADVAGVLLGRPGALLISIAALVSIYGYISANMLTVPRSLFALAEGGDFPAAFGRIHPRFRTPYVSIVVFALLVWVFSQLAGFAWNVTLSAVARILYYAAICVAVPVLRARQPGAAAFRLKGGIALPAAGVLICALLLGGVDFSKSVILLVTIAIGLLNWALVRGSPAPAFRAPKA
jgi:basic amino acid/polyamine antiporter, APA family